ncbi:MAG: helix-turn-helix domain-containing protein [Clostridia bacterium]|nr:helix-turn-helix domain-containing protein [Clostridia bacterium]
MRDNNQIKAYVHPTRIILLQLLSKESRTISSIAKELGVHPANITHHFKLLERAGLICLVEKKDTGRNIEKYYRSIAYNFIVNTEQEGNLDKKALALSILKSDLATAISTIKKRPELEMIALLESVRISHDTAAKFIQKLERLVEEFRECSSAEGTLYSINLSLYPNEVDSCPSGDEPTIRLTKNIKSPGKEV